MMTRKQTASDSLFRHTESLRVFSSVHNYNAKHQQADDFGIWGAHAEGVFQSNRFDKKFETSVTNRSRLEQVQLFLNNSRKLMNCRSMKDVYIGKDWTKKQQREQRILRVALQERRDESDRNRDGKTWRIKGTRRRSPPGS